METVVTDRTTFRDVAVESRDPVDAADVRGLARARWLSDRVETGDPAVEEALACRAATEVRA